MAFLEISKLAKNFGGLTAIFDLDMDVKQGQIYGLIGPNGAGKSTALNMIDGTLKPSAGEIFFNGTNISKLPAHVRIQKGIGRVFQDNLFFNSFTVLDNAIAGYHLQSAVDPVSIFFKTRNSKRQKKTIEERARGTLAFVGLESYTDEVSVNLPHGLQRLLCLAIALGTQPQLLLLDEPLTGMNAAEVEIMLNMIRALRDQKGLTCIIIEHNIKAVMGLCDQIAVLNYGLKIADGSPRQIVEDAAVMEAYLGKEEDYA